MGAEEERRDRFTAIYRSNYHRILGYALRRIGHDAAHDVVAEVFLTAWRRLDRVPEGEAARLWLYGTARRVVANQERSRHRRTRLSERVSREPAVGPAEASGAVGEAFARLRPADRELLALAAWEELEPREIAEIYGCSRNAARIRLHRARRRFARELERGRLDAQMVTLEEPL